MLFQVEKKLLEILEEQPNQEVKFSDLNCKLVATGLLGFGVETQDVAYPLSACGILGYDKEREVVYYKNRETALKLLNGEISLWQLAKEYRYKEYL